LNQPLRLVDIANRALTAAWRNGRWQPPTLDPARIEAFAASKENVRRVPGEDWREAFHILADDLEQHASLNPLGRVIANGQLVKLLRARCRAERLVHRHSEIAHLPIEAPVVIMGPMRSGTTRLQRLLACDPRFIHTRLYESLDPVPHRKGVDHRIAVSVAVHAFLRRSNPLIHAIHPTAPFHPEEEFGHLSLAMHGAQFEVQWDVPRFADHGEQRDTRPVYFELRRLLQLNGWARRQSSGRTWLLKCPQYTADPNSLLAAFPDARLICLSRNPATVVGSSASLVYQQRRIHSDTVDPLKIGPEWLNKVARRSRQTAEFRLANPQVPQFDISYDEVSADWRSAIRRLYEFLGWELSAPVLARMSNYLSAAKSHKGHRYELHDFGLTERSVQAAFAAAHSANVPARELAIA
jgi:hypothetical protein